VEKRRIGTGGSGFLAGGLDGRGELAEHGLPVADHPDVAPPTSSALRTEPAPPSTARSATTSFWNVTL
jgi:hypothetical protein